MDPIATDDASKKVMKKNLLNSGTDNGTAKKFIVKMDGKSFDASTAEGKVALGEAVDAGAKSGTFNGHDAGTKEFTHDMSYARYVANGLSQEDAQSRADARVKNWGQPRSPRFGSRFQPQQVGAAGAKS